MTRRAALCLLLSTASSFAAEPQPNFVFINVDDLGYADIQPFGSKLNRTPHLNRMAQEGMKLTCFYAAPVCSPSRAALMTGCYPKRVLPIPNVLFPGGAVGLNPAERTVAEVLKDAGYATACVGKWHLGDQPDFLPTRQGFDYYYGIPYSNDMGPAAEGAKSNLGDRLPDPQAPFKTPDPKIAGGDEVGIKRDQPPIPLLRNEKVIDRVRAQEQTELVSDYTDEALEFIRANKARRFFLYLAHSSVHFPIYPGKAFRGKSGNGLYGDWVEETDWSVGRVLDTLRDLGLDSKTLVIFTSDNGGTQRAVNAPLRGFKASTFEGGMRPPTIAWWPGRIPAGTAVDAITSMMDVLPTFAKLASAKLPNERKLDGHDISEILTGKTQQSSYDAFYYYRGLRLQAIRQGAWKLHLASQELYNLESDIAESTNIAKAHPEMVAHLKDLAERSSDDLGTDGIGPGCRSLGEVTNPQPLIARDGKIREGFVPLDAKK